MADLEAESDQFLLEEKDSKNEKTLANTLAQDNVIMYLQFVFFGIGSILPTYVIFAAVDYFDDVFPKRQPEFALNVIYNLLLFCGCFVNLVWCRNSSFNGRIILGFSIIAVCMLSFVALDRLELCGTTCVKSHFWSVLVVAGILGIANSLCQSTLFGLTSHVLPPLFTQGLMFGVSICGLIITILRIICKATTTDVHWSSYLYFGATTVFILLVIFLYIRLTRGEAFLKYYKKATKYSFQTMAKQPIRCFTIFSSEAIKVLHYKKVFSYCFLLALVNVQEFMVMPSVVTMAKDFLGNGWFPVFLVLIHNFGDFLGRGPMAAFFTYSLQWSWLAMLVRFSLVIGICLSVPPYLLSHKPAWMATFVALLGISTGHLTTSLIAYASTDVPGKAKETVGYLGILSITLGMALGSGLSLGLEELINKANS